MPDSPFRLRIEIAGGGVVVFDKKLLRATMRQAGAEIAALARSLVRKSAGGGRYYSTRRQGGLELHQASAPGQAPASLSGALANSIKVRPTRSGDGVSIRDSVFYALFLEAGAKGGGPGRRNKVSRAGGRRSIQPTGQRVLRPRPFLSAAVEQKRGSIETRVRAAIVDGVKFQRMS